MPTKIDHLVVAVQDLPQTINFFEKILGIPVFAGGRHKSLGTINAIIPLQDNCYIELLSIDPAASKRDSYPFRLSYNGSPTSALTAFCLSGDIENLTKTTVEQISMPLEISDMSRESSDGKIVSWKLALSFDIDKRHHGAMPFFIEWSPTTIHPSKTTVIPSYRLKGLEITTNDRQAYTALEKINAQAVTVFFGEAVRLKATIQSEDGHTVTLSSEEGFEAKL